MTKKRQSIYFYEEDLKRLKELQQYYNMNSIGEVSMNEVVRQALKVLHNELEKQGKVGGTH